MNSTSLPSGVPPDSTTHDYGPSIIHVTIPLAAASILTVLVRFAVRWRSVMGLGLDDWLILASLVRENLESVSKGAALTT